MYLPIALEPGFGSSGIHGIDAAGHRVVERNVHTFPPPSLSSPPIGFKTSASLGLVYVLRMRCLLCFQDPLSSQRPPIPTIWAHSPTQRLAFWHTWTYTISVYLLEHHFEQRKRFRNHPPVAYSGPHSLKCFSTVSMIRDCIETYIYIYGCPTCTCTSLQTCPFVFLPETTHRDHRPVELRTLEHHFGCIPRQWCKNVLLNWRWELEGREKLNVSLHVARFPFAYPLYRRTNVLGSIQYTIRCLLLSRRAIFEGTIL